MSRGSPPYGKFVTLLIRVEVDHGRPVREVAVTDASIRHANSSKATLDVLKFWVRAIVDDTNTALASSDAWAVGAELKLELRKHIADSRDRGTALDESR